MDELDELTLAEACLDLGAVTDYECEDVRIAVVSYERLSWRPIAEAPTDGTVVLVYAPAYEGLPSMITTAAYHEDAGWCVDELRTVTHFRALPLGPWS